MTLSATLQPLTECAAGQIAEAVGGMVSGDAEARFGPVATDSRALAGGEFFLALRGDRFDGHDYCAAALAAGAAGLIVDREFDAPVDDSAVVIRVEDTLRAYGDLAAWRRREWGGRVLAISGSAGKTTTRRLLARALRDRVPALEPIRNFNNLIGLPHTLLRLEARHEIAVLELGMNEPGELRRLTEIAGPNVAGLTRIGRAHIGMFESEEALVRAKLDLFDCAEPGAPLAVNAGCARSRAAFVHFGADHPIVSFRADGSTGADCHVRNARPLPGLGYEFDLVTPAGVLTGLEIRHFGRHMLENVAAAAAMLSAAGLDPAWIAEAAADFRNEADRGQVRRAGEWTLILDCYNAAPESMIAAIETLAESPHAGRTVLVLADMLELGGRTRAIHDSLLEPLYRLAPELTLVIGEEMTRIAGRLREEKLEAFAFEDAETLSVALAERLQPGDRVLFKGARAFALEKIAAAIAPDLS